MKNVIDYKFKTGETRENGYYTNKSTLKRLEESELAKMSIPDITLDDLKEYLKTPMCGVICILQIAQWLFLKYLTLILLA